MLGHSKAIGLSPMAFLFSDHVMIKISLLILTISLSLKAQVYPRWFLFQGEVPCHPNAAAVANPSTFHRDTAVAYAFLDGCEKIARYTDLEISGGQLFWETEAGTYAMGSNYTEQFDSSLTDGVISRSKVLDSFVDRKKIVVLVASPSCKLDDDLKEVISVRTISKPSWVEQLPEDKNYAYGVGASEEYFYESSSWNAAEKRAYMSAARSKRIAVKAMEKQSSIEHQDIRNEDINVVLRDVEIVARWRDVKAKIFYVLARAKK